MVILITGASHTGKTVLAQRMLEQYKSPYLSIDHLKMGLIRSGNTELTPEDDDKLTEYLWPIVREMIKTAIENQQNLIVEGCYVPSDWRSSFEEKYLSQIRFVCLALTDHYIDSHFSDIIEHGSDIESRLVEGSCTMEGLKECNKRFMDTFGAAGEKIVCVIAIGYGMNDTGVIDTILSQQTFSNARKSMWILLYNPSSDDVEYFEGKHDCTPEQKEFIRSFLETHEYDDYDKLIQLCKLFFPQRNQIFYYI